MRTVLKKKWLGAGFKVVVTDVFAKNVPFAKKRESRSHHDFGVLALEVNKILQATPPKLRGEVGMCRNKAK